MRLPVPHGIIYKEKIYYNDAELHFMLAKYYLHVNDCELALEMRIAKV